MLKHGISIEWIENSSILDLCELWLSVNNYSLTEKATEWFMYEEMEIEREITQEKNFNGLSMKPKSIEFNRHMERKKRYKQNGKLG